MRKFKILDIELTPGGPGPDRIWKVAYVAIINKFWTSKQLYIVARNKAEAEHKANQRFGGKL